MKATFLLSMFCILQSTNTFSQSSDCKYDRNELDKFTNKKIVYTKWENLVPFISTDYAPSVRGIVEDTLKEILFLVQGSYYSYDKPVLQDMEQKMKVPANTKLILLLEDDKPVELFTSKETQGSSDFQPPYSKDNKTEKYKIIWSYVLHYRLNQDAVKKITSKGATNIRMYFAEEKYTDYKIAKKKQGVIQNTVSCLL